MKFAAIALIGAASATDCPAVSVSWYSDANCTTAGDAPADTTATDAIETTWATSLNSTCVAATATTSVQTTCTDDTYAVTSFSAANNCSGANTTAAAVNITEVVDTLGCVSSGTDTYYALTVTSAKALVAGAAATLAIVASQF